MADSTLSRVVALLEENRRLVLIRGDSDDIPGLPTSSILTSSRYGRIERQARLRRDSASSKIRTPAERLRAEVREAEHLRRRLESLPYPRRERSIKRCDTFMHEAYVELLPPDFTMADIEYSWWQFSIFLSGRFPDCLDQGGRRDRHLKMLKHQTNEEYTVVCLLAYRGIESLIREELLFADPGWNEKWNSKENGRARIAFAAQEFSDIIRGRHKQIRLLSDGLLETPIGAVSCGALEYLEQAHESFDPKCANDKETKSWRHVYAHEWVKEASLIDALNVLLVYDTVLQLVARAKPPE